MRDPVAVARLPKPALAAAVAVVWTVSVFAPSAFTDDADLYGLLVVVLTLAAGIVAGTWWILLAPWLATVVLLGVGELTSSPCDECYDELGLVGSAFLMAIACVLADVVLAIGVGIRKGTELVRRSRAEGGERRADGGSANGDGSGAGAPSP